MAHKLCLNDALLFARFTRAAGMRDEVKKIIARINVAESIDVENIGIGAIVDLIECAADKKAEAALFEFIDTVLETTGAINAPLDELAAKITELAEENRESVKGFFACLSAVLGKN